MIPYWLLWAYFFLGLILSRPAAATAGGWTSPTAPARPGLPLLAIVGLIAMTVMIGLRYDVGADWDAYERMFAWSGQASFERVIARGDPGYFLLNLIANELGGGVWLVNLACASATVLGIAALARREPEPWLAVLLAIPYLVTVVAMGYTRQAAALGFVMIGLASLLRTNSVFRFILWLALAATFHKTAIVCLPLIAFAGERNRGINIALLASATIGLYVVFLRDSLDNLVSSYIDRRYSSGGAAIRISMSVVPAVIFLLFRGRLGFTRTEGQLWRNFSLVSLIAAAALLLTPSSTAVDRIALYLLPLQFVVLARVPGTLLTRGFGKAIVAGYSGAVLFTWLTFATHAQYWLPYRWWLGS
ncbi:EpsG family protein [Sphingomonas sp. LHG3406-1]|uniref:EpsG family protein n=1 Tax=Sphingomonas sp. LHG3406-1 TaxID=2804617 RepID=UPI00262A6BCB|nr:EpsG family protein [Sphingomonas sp. LHG3406-1]